MILGIDPGERRVGVAVADAETRFARPLEVIDAREQDPVRRIAEIALDLDAELIVVGRPIGLSGRAGPAVETHAGFVERLKEKTTAPVEEFDERLTSVIAERHLRAGGAGRRARFSGGASSAILRE